MTLPASEVPVQAYLRIVVGHHCCASSLHNVAAPAQVCPTKCGIRSRSALKCTVRGLRRASPRFTHATHGMCQGVRGILTILEGALAGKPNERPGGQIKRASHLDSRRDSPDLPAAASRPSVFGATVAPGIPRPEARPVLPPALD